MHKWDQIGTVFLDFYTNLFASDVPSFPHDLEGLITATISDSENAELTAIPSVDEIKCTVFSMHAHKSPGPDGFPPLFYQHFWPIIAPSLIPAIQHFFHTGYLLKSWNHTFATLIPKTEAATKVDHYRPISLCNVSYKIISKLLSDRLKNLLDRLIFPTQAAFIPGRHIHDNSIINHEIMHHMRIKNGNLGLMALKIDMAKAYDRVEWPLLFQILTAHGFCSRFIHLIAQCVGTTSFSFLINGSPFGMLKPSRGLRQGDPISPTLFVLFFDLMARMLHRAELDGHIHGIKVARSSPPVTHLMFADDLTIFCRATLAESESIRGSLRKFSLWSG